MYTDEVMSEVGRFTSRSEEFFPLNWYNRMIEENPVYFEERTDMWHVFTYNNAQQVLKNYEYFSSDVPSAEPDVMEKKKESGSLSVLSINEADPPDHRKIRSIFSTAFTPKSIRTWEPRIKQIAQDLVDAIPRDKEEIDLVQALASPLPAYVITDLFGVPLEDREQFKEWVNLIFLPYGNDGKAELEQQKREAVKSYYNYIFPIVMEKRLNPKEDIISDLIDADIEGEKLTDDEIVKITMALLGAGVETTSHMLASTFYSLANDKPALFGELKNQPELIPNTIDEMLRFRFHMAARKRIVTKDNDLLGVPVKQGQAVKVWMSAANMDQEKFEDPFTLNIHRSNNKQHLTFGNGPHFCLGAPLARMEIEHTLKAFFAAFDGMEATENFDLEANLTKAAAGQTLTHLPVRLF